MTSIARPPSTFAFIPFPGPHGPLNTTALNRDPFLSYLFHYNDVPRLSVFICAHSDVKALSKAALRRHRWHFCPKDRRHVMSPYGKDLCGSNYAYIHMICGGVKKSSAKMLNLWFVEEDAKSKLDEGARWDEVIIAQEVHVGVNFTLPCSGSGDSNVSIARWLSGART